VVLPNRHCRVSEMAGFVVREKCFSQSDNDRHHWNQVGLKWRQTPAENVGAFFFKYGETRQPPGFPTSGLAGVGSGLTANPVSLG